MEYLDTCILESLNYMGKTRTKLIDDSVAEPASAKASAGKEKKPAKKQADSLVAKLQEELGITPKAAEQAKVGEEKLDVGGVKPPRPSSKIKHPTSKKIRSKKYQAAAKDLDRSKNYPLSEALDTVKKMSYSKFNGTLEVHINTLQPGIRGLVSLPFAAGKKIRILAFGKGAEQSGADIFGSDSTLENIEKGKIDFDILITTPEWMPKLAKAARVLGPKGLMPSPKNGTITDDLKKAVEGFQGGKTEYKTEAKAAVIHLGLGKLNQPNEELEANVKTLLQTLGKSRVKKVTLSPTMGPGVKVDLASI
ncbi:MAG: Ribosomal protein [Microgenomates group bacterium Gr01-1014_80]|nr:MAG: Ribosomal protein [Microgenomates group bacterium Gr01-1014_80]